MAPLALLSTSDKTGLIDLARSLVQEFGFDLISSGGTAATLKEAGLPVTKVADYTGFPEILGGRVKTLHPRIHGGILARRDVEQDKADLSSHDIRPIDLVVVNLYPFTRTIARDNVTLPEAIEQIDIGGPTLLRAAAKNFAHLTVLCNPADYNVYLQELRDRGGKTSVEFRKERAYAAFSHTAEYDRAIASYLGGQGVWSKTVDRSGALPVAGSPPNPPFQKGGISEAPLFKGGLGGSDATSADHTPGQAAETLPEQFTLSGQKLQVLRYGENPHQPAAWYETGTSSSGWAAATKLQGKELSYNNLVDLEAARRLISEFTDSPAAAVLKHTNPCGVASGSTLSEAYEKAFAADSVSAFGGIVALNRAIDPPTAQLMVQTFLECVVAPDCEPEAKSILAAKSKLRVLILPTGDGVKETVKAIAGGFLVQGSDEEVENPQEWQVATEVKPTPDQMSELLFAWKVVKHVKSNAIVVTRDRTTLGIGAGQMNRVGAVEIALKQAGDKAQGGILASDGFFPFDDSVRAAAAAGITAIIQPGGSIRDKDSITAANELGLVMVLTGTRHFLH